MSDDDDAGEAFDRAAARAARREGSPSDEDRVRWLDRRRYRTAVGRLVLVIFLLPAHVVAVRAVTVWLIAHLVLIAILASQVAKRWLACREEPLTGRS